MPPPSSGGVHLIEMLNILEAIPPPGQRRLDRPLHLQIEAMKLAYADRAAYLGDSDHFDVPLDWLISKDHAAELRGMIDTKHTRPAHEMRPDIAIPSSAAPGSGNTTHFSVVDQAGNAVANTTTLNFNYGLGLVADGTGIMLNNELDDFAAKPGVPNAFGLVGGAANAPGPDKRPLSSMSPTIVLKDRKAVLVTGAPGGSRIITTVLQVIVNAIDGHKPIGDAVAAPRLHHQWWPDEVGVERNFPADKIRALTARSQGDDRAVVRLRTFDRGNAAGHRRRRGPAGARSCRRRALSRGEERTLFRRRRGAARTRGRGGGAHRCCGCAGPRC